MCHQILNPIFLQSKYWRDSTMDPPLSNIGGGYIPHPSPTLIYACEESYV